MNIGTIFLMVLVVIGLLLLIYSLMTAKKNGTAKVAAAFNEHYLEEEEMARAAGIHFAGGPSVGFFGRMSIVRRVGTDEHGLCLFPTPDFINEESNKRFSTYAQLACDNPIEGLAPILWWQAEYGMMGLVQGGIVRDDGHMRMTLRQYLLDRPLTPKEQKGTLLAIAHALRELHGRGFYHGWLLPRSLYVILNAKRVITGIRIADAGLTYAFGPEKIYKQLQLLEAHDLGMDAYRRHRLLNELVHLSPEQQNKERLKHVGPASDFYTFGSIAARIFSETPLFGAAEIDWSKVPANWEPFLKACLSDKRPDSFDVLWQNS